MNKFALVLFFSFIAFIKGAFTSIDDFNTEPYYSFDWLDEDEQTFEVKFTGEPTDDIFCYLYNSSVVCNSQCTKGTKSVSCKVTGNNCKADGDNPTFKYYYAVYCSESTASDFNKNTTVDKMQTYVNTNGVLGTDAGVTVAVCSGSYLKYSLFLLSLLIL